MITTNGRQQLSTHSFLAKDGEQTNLIVPILGKNYLFVIVFVAGDAPSFTVKPGTDGTSLYYTFTGYDNPLGTTLTSTEPIIESDTMKVFVDIVQHHIQQRNVVQVFVGTETR